MKGLLRVVAIVLVLVALAWAGAEYLLVRQARQAEAQGRIGLGAARMLADPARIGGRFADVTLPMERDRQLALSDVELWVPPFALNTLHASLPARVHWGKPDYPSTARFDGGVARARVSPFRSMALTFAAVETGGISIDREDIVGPLHIEARLTNFGAVIPKDVAAAYRVDLAIADLNLPALASKLEIGEASGQRKGRGAIDGPVVVWLSSVPGPMMAQRPEVMGVVFEGLRVTVDGAEMRIWGQLSRDASGQLSGELALDSPQMREFVMGLAHAGYMPVGFAPLTATALATVSRTARLREAARPAAVSSPDLTELRRQQGSPHIPPRPEGAERIPLRIDSGQIHVGDLPLSALLSRAKP